MLTPVLLELEDAKRHQGEILRRCALLFDENKLTVEITHAFGLAEAATAQCFLEQKHPAGKLVMTV